MKKLIKFLIICLSLILSFPLFADVLGAPRYVIFVDAGSSGSRLHVFQYQMTTAPIPLIKEIFSESVKPGLSSYADQPDAAGSSLKKILDDARDVLQKKGVNVATVSINILATAGMRLLPENKQKAIYASVTSYLKKNYLFAIGDIKSISGQMEGLYGWLDVNYLLENFQMHRATVGSIDMGGASTQIAFATQDRSKLADLISVKINNQLYTVFVKSFLGLGQDQALKEITQDQSAMYCYPQHYGIKSSVTGNFNFASCNAIYANFLRKHRVAQEIVSTSGQSFVAFSAIYYVYNFFDVDKTPGQTHVESRVKTVCSEPWEKLQKEYPKVSEKFLANYCAAAVYHNELLYNVYRMRSDQLVVENKINNLDLDWTLGAVLYSLTQKV